MRFLLLLSLPLSLVNSCLVTQYPVTSTPQPFCGCPFKILNATNLKETVGNHSFYQEIYPQPLLEPSASGDECFRSLACPSDYDLVVFNKDQHKLFTNELSAMCDPFSQQWLVDDGIHEIETFSQLYVTCARLGVCPCYGGSINTPKILDELKNSTFYRKNLTHHYVYPADITYSDDNCPSGYFCAPGQLLINFEPSTGQKVTNTDDKCDPADKEWKTVWNGRNYTTSKILLLCTDFTLTFCGCQSVILNKTNLAQYLSEYIHPFYDGPWYQPIRDPIASGDECFRSLSCPTDYKLVITKPRDYITFADVEVSVMCDPYSQQWLVDDGFIEMETFDFLDVTCVRFEVCPCFGGSIDIPGFWEELVKTEFYRNNLTHHPIQTGTITYSDDNCATNITCPDGWTTVKMGPDDGKDLLESCNANWISNWYSLQYKYYLCADYSTLLS